MEVVGEFGLDVRQVVFVDGAALGAEAEAVVFDFEEGDGVGLFRQGFVEEEDRGFDAGIVASRIVIVFFAELSS